MQQSLITAGIKVPGGADGVFGSSTAGAIMEYQRREGLPVTGKIDDQTAGKLGQAAAPAPVAPSADVASRSRRSPSRASAGSATPGRRPVAAAVCTKGSTSSRRRASRSMPSSTA